MVDTAFKQETASKQTIIDGSIGKITFPFDKGASHAFLSL